MGEKIVHGDQGFLNRIGANEIDNPAFREAEARANALAETCHFNEAVRVIENLITEVTESPLANRFSREEKPDPTRSAQLRGPVPAYGAGFDQVEAEHKRAELLRKLKNLRERMVTQAGDFKAVVMEIEATKREF